MSCLDTVDRGVWPDKQRRKFAAVDADIRAAVEVSHLRGLPADARTSVLRRALLARG